MNDVGLGRVVVRFVARDVDVVLRIDASGVRDAEAEPWDMSVAWPVPAERWWDVRVGGAAERSAERLLWGSRPSGSLGQLGNVDLRCRIDLDGPRWVVAPPSVGVWVGDGHVCIGPPAVVGGPADLVMAMPWTLFARWIGDDAALFGDQVVDQLVMDGSIALLSTLDGVLGLAEVGTVASDVAAFIAWSSWWEHPEVREAVSRRMDLVSS